ncbi:hypothetical protein [Synechococcus sp. PCC 7336]|uniref:hypothetical protein n=1 Tax=Synechococcus sp. PCC 7336 TaxID=195250 RepID=UPI0003469E46|nr:hypothetical protein [Synechococcus sp. PCC 7336]
MSCPIPYEQRQVQVPLEVTREVAELLTDLGLSLRFRPDGFLTAVIRFGLQGSLDRLAITHAELRFSNNRPDKVQWLEMCWRLPIHSHPRLQN